MLEDSLTYKLTSIAEDAIGGAETLFRGRFGLDVRTLRVLRLIDDRPGTTFTELTLRTKFERSATSRLLAQLIKTGLVRRRIDPRDARHFKLYATAAGKALRARADPLTQALEGLMLAPLSDAERRRFMTTLDKILAWIGGGYGPEMHSRFPDARKGKAQAARRGP